MGYAAERHSLETRRATMPSPLRGGIQGGGGGGNLTGEHPAATPTSHSSPQGAGELVAHSACSPSALILRVREPNVSKDEGGPGHLGQHFGREPEPPSTRRLQRLLRMRVGDRNSRSRAIPHRPASRVAPSLREGGLDRQPRGEQAAPPETGAPPPSSTGNRTAPPFPPGPEPLHRIGGAAGHVRSSYSPGPYRSQRELYLTRSVDRDKRRPPTL